MKNNKLKRSLKFKDILILAFSTMIGWGWVSLTGTWSVQGGVIGATFAFLLGATLCMFVGLTYCELTPMLPYAGGELVFSYSAMGYHASWFTGWMIAFAYVGVASWEGPALATAIDYLIPIPKYGYLYTIAGFDVYITWLMIPAIVGSTLIFINFKGIGISAKFQSIATIILAMGGIILLVVSVFNGNIENATPVFNNVSGIFSVILSVPAMFVGFDVIPQVAEEMLLPKGKIPKAIIMSICLAACWYIIMIFSVSVSAPASVLEQSGLTVVNAINYATGRPILGKLVIITAIMGILTSWNGFIIGATRILYSMGKAKMLPYIFGTLHPKYRTPYFATIFIGGITIVTPLLGKNSLGWFVNASSFGTVVAYLMVAVSFVVLRIKEPQMKRPFKLKNGLLVGYISIFVAIFFVILYLPIGSSSLNKVEWGIVLIWVSIGIVFWINSLKYKKINEVTREKFLFNVSDE